MRPGLSGVLGFGLNQRRTSRVSWDFLGFAWDLMVALLKSKAYQSGVLGFRPRFPSWDSKGVPVGCPRFG